VIRICASAVGALVGVAVRLAERHDEGREGTVDDVR
jgi:hypothetical protein